MGEILLQKLSRKELDSGTIPANYVMVEAELTAEGKKTKGGIIVGFSEDIQYADEENSWEADLAQVAAKVYKLPDKLYFNKDGSGMPWETELELQIDDLVFFNVIESRNAVAVECEGKAYKLIPMQDIYCAKRTYWRDKWKGERHTEVIMLNGYVLLEPVYHINDSPLAVDKKGDVDKTRGIVRYVGKPNKRYVRPEYVDFPDLQVGDEVILAPGTALFALERKAYLAIFDNDNLYWVCQRRRISMVLSRGN